MTRRWEGGSLEPVGARDHARGPEDAPVTLVKYGDFECPYCGQLHRILRELQERAGERVRFVFRHFPLDSAHWFVDELTGADGRGAVGRPEGLAGRVGRLFDAIKDPKSGEPYTNSRIARMSLGILREDDVR